MRTEVQAVLRTGERKAVGGGVARILKVVLPELLGRSHIQRPRIYVCDFCHRVVEYLPSGVRGKQFVSLRQLKVPDQRILQFTDYGMRLVVLYRGAESGLPVLHPNLQMKLEGLAVQAVIVYTYSVCTLGDYRCAVASPDFYFLAFRGVVVEPPQSRSARKIVPVHPV